MPSPTRRSLGGAPHNRSYLLVPEAFFRSGRAAATVSGYTGGGVGRSARREISFVEGCASAWRVESSCRESCQKKNYANCKAHFTKTAVFALDLADRVSPLPNKTIEIRVASLPAINDEQWNAIVSYFKPLCGPFDESVAQSKTSRGYSVSWLEYRHRKIPDAMILHAKVVIGDRGLWISCGTMRNGTKLTSKQLRSTLTKIVDSVEVKNESN